MTPFEITFMRNITYLSPPAQVSMADRYFEIASIGHFWVQRRFDVFRRLAGQLVPDARAIAEFGCGHGLLQRQIEDQYGREVMGFDLNEFALKLNVSRLSQVCCYDISQKDATLQGRFDLVLLFDVLEHIAEEDQFLSALLYHLAPAGRLVVNVPAGQWAYSAYDRADGHMRRYSMQSLRDVAMRNNLEITNWTYWGLPLLPLVVLRKLWLSGSRDNDKIVSIGFDSGTGFMNQMLRFVSSCEPIPHTFLGSSLMAVLEVGGDSR
jgi:SAM-dependent methyltransferase